MKKSESPKFIQYWIVPGLNTNEIKKQIKKSIKSNIEKNHIRATQLLKIVSDVCEIPVSKMKGLGRTREVSDSRHLFNYFVRKNTTLGVVKIGDYLNKSHCTIVSSIKRANNLIQYDSGFKLKHDAIQESIIKLAKK